MRANWEPLVENSSDGYHSFSTHGACFECLVWLSGDLGVGSGASPGVAESSDGHAALEYLARRGRAVANQEPPPRPGPQAGS
jgi:hypothetical protein